MRWTGSASAPRWQRIPQDASGTLHGIMRVRNFVQDDASWDRTEACTQAGLEYALQPGEGAFYGPKLEFTLGMP